MAWDGIRRIIWAKNFDEMEIIGTLHFSVAVSIEADPEFKAMILAAGVTHSAGNLSIDHILKRHRDEFLERFDSDRTCPPGCVKELLLVIRGLTVELAGSLSAIGTPPAQKTGAVAAVNALIRLQATFHAAVQLIANGLGIEAEAVIRQGLEQVAWSLSVMSESSHDRVRDTKANASISTLKRLFPGSGVIYGLLSDSAHLAPRTHGRFVTLSEDKLTITIRDPDDCAASTFFLLLLLDAYVSVAQELLNSWRPPKWSPELPRIECTSLIEKYKTVLPGNSDDLYSKWRRKSA